MASAPPPDGARPSGRPGRKAFALRLSPAIHAAVERLASAELRSVNAQIEVLLREALKARGVAAAPADPRPSDHEAPR